MSLLLEPLSFASGAHLKNRFALAPLTNQQSFPDGRLSDEEFRWLSMRAEGGFGLVMTCAASVSREGVTLPGQLGVHDDMHLEGLTRLAAALTREGAHAVAQLHHGGMRALRTLSGMQPVAPSDDSKTGARALTRDEVQHARDDFIAAALRAERAGFDGVELHAAHGYLICQFLSAHYNRREDEYGGAFENRARLLWEIIEGVRAACRPGFSLGVRLSPERFGMRMDEILGLAQALMRDPRIDYVDMSLWDVFKEPDDEAYKGKSLMAHFAALERGRARLGVAGDVMTGDAAARCIAEGVDFVLIGRAGIFHHDFPKRVAADAHFKPVDLPVGRDYLRQEGVGAPFAAYLAERWPHMVVLD